MNQQVFLRDGNKKKWTNSQTQYTELNRLLYVIFRHLW